MQHITPLFERAPRAPGQDYARHVASPTVAGAAAWVTNGEGVATIKWCGLGVRIGDGRVDQRVVIPMRRRRVDTARGYAFVPRTSVPPGFEAAGPPTGYQVHGVVGAVMVSDWCGWVPVDRTQEPWVSLGATDVWQHIVAGPVATYELVGPGIRHNPYRLTTLALFRHRDNVLLDVPTDYDHLSAYFVAHPNLYGVVWRRDPLAYDTPLVRVCRTEFGLSWPEKGRGYAHR